jgi:FkbM family methyltransferase
MVQPRRSGAHNPFRQLRNKQLEYEIGENREYELAHGSGVLLDLNLASSRQSRFCSSVGKSKVRRQSSSNPFTSGLRRTTLGRLSAATDRFSNVRLTQAAVGERSGQIKLYISDKLNVDHRTYKAEGESRRAVPTQMIALDDYFKLGQRVDLLKMDIQGFELDAVRGAQRVLQENPDINLLLEFWPAGLAQAGVGWEELVELLQRLNMNLALVRTCGLIPFDVRDVRSDPSWYVNVFAHRTPPFT